MKKVLLFVLIFANLFMLSFIFGNSLKDAPTSTEQSMSVTKKINDTLESMNIPVKVTNNTVRTSAHFTEFLILGVFSALLFILLFGVQKRWETFAFSYGYPLVSCFADELIQKFFSKGRTFQLIDIGIDTLGLALGVSAVLLTVYAVIKRRKEVD